MDAHNDTEISSIAKQMEVDTLQLVEIRREFIQEAITFFKNWCWSTAESIVKGKPELTTSLGTVKIAELKERITQLQGHYSKIVVDLIDVDSLWPREAATNRMHQEILVKLEEPLKFAAGELGPILEEFGYLPDSIQTQGSWRKRQSTPILLGGTRPCYPYSLKLDERMLALLTDYVRTANDIYIGSRKIREIQKKRVQKNADDLWNNS